MAGFAFPALHAADKTQDREPIVVRMEGKKFIPDQITIKAGDTVEWKNSPDGPAHQVTDDPEQAMDNADVAAPKGTKTFDSGKIRSGESYRYRFTVPGTYRYTCPPHEMEGMSGRVVVQP